MANPAQELGGASAGGGEAPEMLAGKPTKGQTRNPARRFIRGLAFAAIAAVQVALIARGLAWLSPALGWIGLGIGLLVVIGMFREGYIGTPFEDLFQGTKAGTPTPRAAEPDQVPAPAAANPVLATTQVTAPNAVTTTSTATTRRSTTATYSKEWSFDGTRLIKKQGPMVRVVRTLLGLAFMGLALLLLLFGLWPVTLVAGLIGFACMPREGLVGAWVGNCPTCLQPVIFADPTMSATLTPLQRLCPGCTAPIEIVRDRFLAIPGTGAPKEPATPAG
jgi:hypothetical protein